MTNKTQPAGMWLRGWGMAVLALWGSPVPADETGPDTYTLGIGGALKWYSYKEFDDAGVQIDREDGTLPGITAFASWPHGAWTLRWDVAYYSGDADYEGRTNTGVPISTRTDEDLFELEARAERWFGSGGAGSYAPYAGFGLSNWQRDIHPTTTSAGAPVQGLSETYAWWSGFVGLRGVMARAERSSWLVDLRLVRILEPEVDVDFLGTFDNTSLDLGSRYGVKFSIPWRYMLDRTMALDVNVFAESWKFGRSATRTLTAGGVPVGTIFEPKSETQNFGVMLGVNRQF